MNINFLEIFFFIFFLYSINTCLKKFQIGLDIQTANEKHKTLLNNNKSTPLSGTIYFVILFIYLLYGTNFSLLIFNIGLFLLGFFADLKFVTSYKKRLIIQFFLISIFFIFEENISISTRLILIDNLMNYELARVLICTFFLMVLINGFNFIDGTNCLVPLNFLIITIVIIFLNNDLNIIYFNNELEILALSLLIFCVFNFFGKNFLGDGAVYGISFFLGYTLINISIINNNISPYFIANLLWFPAFENLFSIIRRNILKTNTYLPDNDHLHHLIYKFLKKKKLIKNNVILSSFVGILINLILSINYIVSFKFYDHTITQITIIIIFTFLYIFFYSFLKKKIKNDQ